ncbi:dehydrogenase [Skermanella rosea]|uniref:zinc-binding alcohol dehydrogenase n=1 Tax=Skermanella rosea TaxID=1817965 RepID=UPI00193418B5|nr:zinc-binding alcohol dehydrogenase [Skermanella rosea]UEM03574.1 dehydrogenase [Skermanella rosea]
MADPVPNDPPPGTATAFWIVAPGRGELREAALPAPGPGEVLVRAEVSAVSRGTESLVFQGRVPLELFDTMRCPFQEGDFPGPVKYGYCMVGMVERGPAALEGRRVFCLHPHQDRFVVPADAVVPVPDGVPADRAALAANMETAVNILWDALPPVGSRIAVIGAGVVGCLTAWLAARIPAARVELIDVNPARAAVAEALGVGFAPPETAARDCDIVIHASGNPDGLVTALDIAGFEATVVEASWYGTRPVAAPLGAAFHPRRLRLVSSQVGAVAPAMRPRWGYRDRMALALDLLKDSRPDILLTGSCLFADLTDIFPKLALTPGDQPAAQICHLVRYGGER